jgi:hypothetical protein
MTHGAFAPLILPCHCPNHDPPRPTQPTRSNDRPLLQAGPSGSIRSTTAAEFDCGWGYGGLVGQGL